MINDKNLAKLKSDLQIISARISEFMQERYVLPNDELLKDLLKFYDVVREKLISLDSELFGDLKEIKLTKTVENSLIYHEPFYTSASFTKFRNDVYEALRNFDIFENMRRIAEQETKQVVKQEIITKVPFLSISFDEKDKAINNYFKSILNALKIDFETGEKYSKDSIPEKIKKRIDSSDLIIVVLVKRDELKNGGHTTPGWLIRELAYAQGKSKEVIALVENGIKDIAGLNMDKEVIYFTREDKASMQVATIKFLEALKEHKLV